MALLTIPMVVIDDNSDTGAGNSTTLLALTYVDLDVAGGAVVNYYWS